VRNLFPGIIALALWAAPFVDAAEATAARLPKPSSTAKPSVEVTDPVEIEFKKLMEMDDAAQDEADKWIKDAKAFEAKGAGLPQATLNARIQQRFDEVKRSYEKFLEAHPRHAKARLAYGSFLNDINEEEDAAIQWEKAKETDPTNPAAWNNLANHYGHLSPVKKAFEYYAKAIELDPNQAVYLQNLATTVYLFRQDAKEFYGITEEEVFSKALDLYRRAQKLDPKNFTLATDLAQSYYGIHPLRTDEALKAWDYALQVAHDDIEREGVYLHIARVELNSGRFDDARRHINSVTNAMYDVLKDRLTRSLKDKETKASPGAPGTPPPVGSKNDASAAKTPSSPAR
jgi:tetratricopeptide (TPR) repeat protein